MAAEVDMVADVSLRMTIAIEMGKTDCEKRMEVTLHRG